MAIYKFENLLKEKGVTEKDVKSLGVIESDTKEPGYLSGAIDRVSNTINTAGQNARQAVSGEGQYAGQSSIRRGTQATAEAFNAVPQIVTDLMPQPVRTGIEKIGGVINKGFNFVTNKISDVKLFKELGDLEAQGFITKENAPELYRVKEALGTVSPLGEISGDILAAKGASDIAQKAADTTKNLVNKVKVSSIRNDASSVVNSHLKVADMELKDPDIGPQLKTPEGTAQLLERTKINIVDGLRGDNFGTVADKIAKIDTSTLSSLDDFKAAIKEVAGKKTSLFSAEPTAQVRLAAAIKDSTPNYELLSKAERAKVLGQVKEGGVIQGRTVTPSKMQIEAGTEVSKIPSYNPSSTKLEKFNVVKAEVERQAETLKTSLQNENVITPKKEYSSRVKAKLKEIPNESLLLQKSDPVIKNYLRVYNNTIKQVDGNLSGVLELRKMLDDTYENARGKNAFGSDKAAALDDVHTAVRNTLTEYLIEKASTDVKASLRTQWNLYRALDELRTAAANESGSKFGRLKQKYPITNKIIESGVRGAGLGAGLNIIQ